MLRENSPAVRVLIVEDEGLIRWSLGQMLGAAGATVVEAADAKSALAALQAEPRGFDVAVLDVHLPDGDGFGLLATIRRTSPATPVLLMTAHGTPQLRQTAWALGALGLVDKPFDLDTMVSLILGAAAAA